MGKGISNKDVTFYPPTQKKKHYGIIGGGPIGLLVLKHLKQLGHTATVFETMPGIGGVYAKVYDGMLLTSSSVFTAVSDHSDGNEDKPYFWDDEDFLQYLDGFADKFDLYKNVKLRNRVQAVKRDMKTGKWCFTVEENVYTAPHRSIFNIPAHHPEALREKARHEIGEKVLEDFFSKAASEGFWNVRYSYPYQYIDHLTGELVDMIPDADREQKLGHYEFDGIVIATGTNNWPSRPKLLGEERFKGVIIHSDNYRNTDIFKDKRVLILGAGEAGSDITNNIAQVAKKVALVCRGKHGHIIPRKQSTGRVTDLNTNRIRYSNPKVFGDWIGWTNQHFKKLAVQFGIVGESETDKKILRKVGELNLEQKTSAFSKFGCKNEAFVTAMVVKGSEFHRDNFEVFENKVVFDSGKEFECDLILQCTGYKNDFPFFYHESVKDEVICENPRMTCSEFGSQVINPRLNYKMMFPPQIADGSICLCGFARPAFGALPPTGEMQARYFSLIADEQLRLPSPDVMRKVALQDGLMWESRFPYDAPRVRGLCDFQLYLDDLARLMNALPDLKRLFFLHPQVWYKVMFGPLTTHQYSLQGPWENFERAKDVYSRVPVGDKIETTITLSFLLTAKFLSLLGFKKFTPNHF